MQSLLQWLKDNKDSLTLILSLVVLLAGSGALPTLIKSIRGYFQQQRAKKIPFDTFPFTVIPPGSDVLEAVMGGKPDDPLADRNIQYQQRITDFSTQQKLRDALQQTRWLLIVGRTGLGKTREAAELAQSFNRDGWTVLHLKQWEWLDEPRSFPMEKIGSQTKLLFLLDDLNRPMFHSRRFQQSPKAEDLAQPQFVPLQERLLRSLNYYEAFCRAEEIRVIATARNERTPHDGEPLSEWEKLAFDKFPLWERFTCYELPPPQDEAIVDLLRSTIPTTNIEANPDDYARIAERNDRTFKNVVENLKTHRNEGKPLTRNSFLERLGQTWKYRFEKAEEKYAVAPAIYAAIGLLRQVDVELYPYTVEATARLFIKGNGWQKLRCHWQIYHTLRYLHEAEQILEPRDGQIEAAEVQLEVAHYLPRLLRLLLKLSKRHPKQLVRSLFGLSYKAVDFKQYQESIAGYERILKIQPDLHEAWNNRGVALESLGQFEDAIASYDQALRYKPDKYEAWCNRGTALNNLGQFEDAITSYDQALKYKLDDYDAWNNRGVVLRKLRRFEDAVASYNQALRYKPNKHEAWNNQGVALVNLKQFNEAIASFDQALRYKPDHYEAWYCRGIALESLERFEDAITSYDQALRYRPNDDAWINRGIALFNLGRFEEAIASFDQALSIKSDNYAAWNNQGLALDGLERYEEAITSFDHAIELKPDHHEAWYNRGIALSKLGRFEEAIASFDKSVELLPDDADAFYWKACCYALLGQVEDAIANLQRAIELNENYREDAETDADFDAIRGDDRFQTLVFR